MSSSRPRSWPGAAAFLVLVVTACTSGPGPATPRATADAAEAIAAPQTTTSADVGRPERLQPVALIRPAQPAVEVTYRLALVDDYCTDRDLPAPMATESAMTVLDRSYALPSGFVPPDLVPAADAGLTGASGTKLVRAVLVDDLAAMRAAWEAAGMTIVVDSAYRSSAAQAATYDAWVAEIGPAAAAARTARPGHSEHQLGTAIDVSSPGWTGRFGDWAVESAEGAWMAEHAWEFGFVMSYPAGRESDSCYGYEPWHYRWIGRAAAAAHRDSGLLLRDFLARHAGG